MKKIILSVLVICTLISCEKELEYTVHSDFEPYIQNFIDEGVKRGKSFDFQKSGLIVEYADLSDKDVGGLCHYEEPIRIEIDEDYWKELSGENNEQQLKEKLIFHELGHRILDRDHKNNLFQYGDWISMMNGSYSGGEYAETPDGRFSWNMNFRGFRKEYYLYELFNPNTQTPDWANIQPVFYDNPDANTIFNDNFSSNEHNWWIGTTDTEITEMTSGYYKVQTPSDNGYYYAKEISIDKSQDFYIELKMKFAPQGNDGDYHNAGLVWGGSEGSNLYYLCFTKDKKITIGNYGWYIEIPCPELNTNDYNSIELRKIGDIFYFSINGKFIYHTDYDGFFGDLFGFTLDGNSTVWIDKLQISYLGAITKKSAKSITVSEKTYKGTTPEIKKRKR